MEGVEPVSKRPPPPNSIAQYAPKRRSTRRPNPKRDINMAHIYPSPLNRHQIIRNYQTQRQHTSRPDSTNRPRCDETPNTLRQSTPQICESEDRQHTYVKALPSDGVRQPTPKRLEPSIRNHERRRQPGRLFRSIKRTGNHRVRVLWHCGLRCHCHCCWRHTIRLRHYCCWRRWRTGELLIPSGCCDLLGPLLGTPSCWKERNNSD
jgi:hypothetical protein